MSTPLLVGCALWAGLATDAIAQGSAATDRAVLEALYDATGGPNWIDNTNWKTASPLGEWFGVTIDTAGRVTRLEVPGNRLAGPIPAALGELALLRNLDLGYRWDSATQQSVENTLTGPLPAELGDLANLEGLFLGWNSLTGPVPSWLGRLTSLRTLDLGRNELTGPLPAELGNLANLEELYLWENTLTGPVPSRLGRLTSLRTLDLGWNALTGPLPPGLGRLSNLRSLSLLDNELTGRIPEALGNLSNLEELFLAGNGLTGPVPPGLGRLSNLRSLSLEYNDLSGPIPSELGSLMNLKALDLSGNWGVSGSLPASLRLTQLDIWLTQACAPAAWRPWLETIAFSGAPCGDAPATIDVAIFYTPGARDDAGGTAAIEAEIDLLIAMANEAYAVSGVRHRMSLVARSEVPYTESGDAITDFGRFQDPADGHMDEVHATRERTGADLAHLLLRPYAGGRIGGLAELGGPLGLTDMCCPIVFVHETGHNMGLRHDRYTEDPEGGTLTSDPAYGYVNQRALESGAPASSRWSTIMGESNQCLDAGGFGCPWLLRFSNPRQHYNGDALGIPYSTGSGVTGAADSAAVLNAMGPAVALWRDHVPRPNRPPEAAGTLPDRRLTGLPSTLEVDVSQAFVDPDGDLLTYTVSSSSPRVVAAQAAGARVTLAAVGEGTAMIQVTATDPGGLSAIQSFTVTVTAMRAAFTDDPIVPGVTPIKAIHFTELRTRIDALRSTGGLARFSWTDRVLRPGVTPVRRVHLLELRQALAEAYSAAGRAAPRWTDTSPAAGTTPIRALHVTELRAAVLALE